MSLPLFASMVVATPSGLMPGYTGTHSGMLAASITGRAAPGASWNRTATRSCAPRFSLFSLNSCLNGIPNVPWSQKRPPFNTVSPRYLSVVVTPLGSSLFVQNVETLRSAVHPPKTVEPLASRALNSGITRKTTVSILTGPAQ